MVLCGYMAKTKKRTQKTARKRVVKRVTAKQAQVSRVQDAPRRGDHLSITYDTTLGEVRRSFGLPPGKDADMRYGDFLKKIGEPVLARVLKKITEKYA